MASYKKVTGIGGIFFKCENPDSLKQWYAENLGLNTDKYGALFEFGGADSTDKSYLQWSTFPKDTKYMTPSKKDFMINYRVGDIKRLVSDLKQASVTVLDEIEEYDYGKFVHILDPEGNKIELWEPIDEKLTEEDKSSTIK